MTVECCCKSGFYLLNLLLHLCHGTAFLQFASLGCGGMLYHYRIFSAVFRHCSDTLPGDLLAGAHTASFFLQVYQISHYTLVVRRWPKLIVYDSNIKAADFGGTDCLVDY